METTKSPGWVKSNLNTSLLWSVISLLAAVGFSVVAPLEKILGANARLVYFHGAWVWVALLAFAAAALAGLVGLLARRQALNVWSRAFGWTGQLFWITFLPMSLFVMAANWNGLFLQEPRFRVPLNLAVVGLLLQIGLWLLPDIRWNSMGNLAFGVLVWATMRGLGTVLHPESPVFNSDARSIQVYFIIIVILLAAAAFQLSRWFTARLALPREKHA
ncbi:MAG: hypothetical protein ACK2UW_04895 [Anaerolineales bacterium]